MSKLLKTVTIGIPAYNEEANIALLLESIVMQKITNFKLEKVIVICDGCIDNTSKIVKSLSRKHRFIRCIDDKKRLGQAKRLNQLYQISSSDIIVTFDADTVLGLKDVISIIVSSFNNQKVGIVGCMDVPYNPNNFVEKVGVVWQKVWLEARQEFNGGSTVHNHHGCASALSKNIYKKINVPKNIIANDDYIYFKALELGYCFKFAKKAKVYYKVPSTLKDFFIQTTRMVSLKQNVSKYFGGRVYKHYSIPSHLKAKALLKVFFEEPILLLVSLFLQIIVRISKNYFREDYKNDFWTVIKSSKGVA